MGCFNSKHEEDENCLRIEDLPNEMMVEIFSNLNNNEKMKASMVNRRWFGIVNKEIKTLSVKLPEEDNQEFLNLIERFPNLKNVEINPCLWTFAKTSETTTLRRLQYLLPTICGHYLWIYGNQ